MRYWALCPICQVRTTINLATLTTTSHPVCPTCRTPLRLSTETMQNTPQANVWIVPPGSNDGRAPAIEHVPNGLAPQRQAAFEALMRRACIEEAGLAGYPEL